MVYKNVNEARNGMIALKDKLAKSGDIDNTNENEAPLSEPTQSPSTQISSAEAPVRDSNRSVLSQGYQTTGLNPVFGTQNAAIQKTDRLSNARNLIACLMERDKISSLSTPDEDAAHNLIRKKGEAALLAGDIDSAVEAASAYNALDAAEEIGEELVEKVAAMNRFQLLEDMGHIKSASAMFGAWLEDKMAYGASGITDLANDSWREEADLDDKYVTDVNKLSGYAYPYPYLSDKKAYFDTEGWVEKLKRSAPSILGGGAALAAGIYGKKLGAPASSLGNIRRFLVNPVVSTGLAATGAGALASGVAPEMTGTGLLPGAYNVAVRNPLTTGMLAGAAASGIHNRHISNSRTRAAGMNVLHNMAPPVLAVGGAAGLGRVEYNRPNSWIRDLLGQTNRTILPSDHPSAGIHRYGRINPLYAGIGGAALGAGAQMLADRHISGKIDPVDALTMGAAGGVLGAGTGHLYNQYNVDYGKVKRPVNR